MLNPNMILKSPRKFSFFLKTHFFRHLQLKNPGFLEIHLPSILEKTFQRQKERVHRETPKNQRTTQYVQPFSKQPIPTFSWNTPILLFIANILRSYTILHVQSVDENQHSYPFINIVLHMTNVILQEISYFCNTRLKFAYIQPQLSSYL